MKQYPIQFTQLCEMMAELRPKQTIRITVLENTVSSEAGGQIHKTNIVVPVTTEAADGHVLMCHILIGTFEHMATGPMNPSGHARAIKTAQAVCASITKALKASDYTVLGGYIDVPNISNVFASQPEMPDQAEALNHLTVLA